MAKIKFGMMMTDARGKLGGQVFTKSREGATVRTKVTPVNRRSPAQMAVRSALGALSRAWSYDPSVDRAAWTSAAESVTRNNIFGDSYSLTGKSYFQSANQNRALIDLPMINEPGVLTEMPSITAIQFGVTYGTTECALTVVLDGSAAADWEVVAAVTKPNSLGRNNFSGQYRMVGHAVGKNGTVDVGATFDYLERFGETLENQRISVQVWLIHKATGLASPKRVESVQTTLYE